MKVVFICSEMFPFSKTGGLADVCGALPSALKTAGVEMTVITPRYRCVSPQTFGLKRLNPDVSVGTLRDGLPVYFIENEDYFERDGIYGDHAMAGAWSSATDDIAPVRVVVIQNTDSVRL